MDSEVWYFMGYEDETPVYSLAPDGRFQPWVSRRDASGISKAAGKRATFKMPSQAPTGTQAAKE